MDTPFLLSADQSCYWTLPSQLQYDFFSFRDQGAGALLLIGMHLAESMPWRCARNPVYFAENPGPLDREAKRILGKRFQSGSRQGSLPLRLLDTIALVLQRLAASGHCFDSPPHREWPDHKNPGQLLPRRILASARIELADESFELHARNFSEISQCLHAELVLLFELSRRLSEKLLPLNALKAFQLRTTLKPCKMCAAFLYAVGTCCRSFHVQFDEHDPGRLAADTLLDRHSYSLCSASPSSL